MPDKRSRWRRLLLLPPIVVGVAFLAIQLRGREVPEQGAAREIARPVRVIEARPTDFVPRAVGYGFAEPGSVWNGVAQVSGTISERHPDLEAGRLFDAGTVIFRIDPSDYKLRAAQIQASIQSVKAELAELDINEQNTRVSLDIERRMDELAKDDLARKRSLLQRGNVSESVVDEAEQAVLLARQKVQELENQLNVLPARRQVLEATVALNEARLGEARLNLQRTALAVPFDARIAEVRAEQNQYVSVGEVLAVADSIDVAEVAAQVPIEQMAALVRGDVDLRQLSASEIGQVPKQFGLDARVHLRTGSVTASWNARVDRISPSLDPETRTVGVVVAVDEPYRQAVPGEKPPLIKNMYVQVDLTGPPRPDRIVIPRVALHGSPDAPLVYIADGEDRLIVRPVIVGPVQGDEVVIRSGIAPGERVVVSDLIPAINGMLLAPTRSDDDDVEDGPPEGSGSAWRPQEARP
ncbi:MAG: efflux RND transporter periplasmic adaptor subunit [Rhodospirillales bacterium]|nr:efflux RND transporter periplasmic adaptor subunit [Rhodospirillales bacterium]